MEDVKQASPGALETLMRKIPGYGGYLDREQRRDADRLHREFLAKGTSSLKAKIQDIQEEMLRNGDMVAAQTTPLIISQTGIEADINEFSADQAVLYGVVAVLAAAMAGWGATLLFRNA